MFQILFDFQLDICNISWDISKYTKNDTAIEIPIMLLIYISAKPIQVVTSPIATIFQLYSRGGTEARASVPPQFWHPWTSFCRARIYSKPKISEPKEANFHDYTLWLECRTMNLWTSFEPIQSEKSHLKWNLLTRWYRH